jgi:hypothetical protein
MSKKGKQKTKHTKPEFVRLVLGRYDLEVFNDANDEKIENICGIYLTHLVGTDMQAAGVRAVITRFDINGYESDGSPRILLAHEDAIVTEMKGIAL